LMCRASNAVDIKYEHMGWHFLFCSHTWRTIKVNNNIKGGERPHSRHIYANPGNPSVCPILGLGI
jgi:hypothetical protein